jgi:NACHT domain
MSSIPDIRQAGRQRPAAGPLRLRLRRLLSRLLRPVVRTVKALRIRRDFRDFKGRSSWRSNRGLFTPVRLLSYGGALLLLLWLIWALYVVVRRGSDGLPVDLEARCQQASFSCGTLAGALVPVLSIAVASAIFLVFRLRHVRRPYVRRAQHNARDVVPSAGSIIGDVVGRDELCNVIIDDVRDPHTRRPHVIVGGVGAGKTALLVQLTKLLAERGAVPVPVRLRDAQSGLDFRELARRRFLGEADQRLLSDTEGEKVWRHLHKNQQVVVLADGLEEALIEGEPGKDRDNLIRLAIRQANADRLPLIIASRPHNLLRETEATIIELEPLSEEAALEYVRPTGSGNDERRLDWIVETADVTEAPLYLQITRQLHSAGLMEYVSPGREDGRLDTRSVDRAELRLRLLRTWTDALLAGHVHRGLPLPLKDRKASLLQLSALACIGLKQDKLEVKYEDFDALRSSTAEGEMIGQPKSRQSPLLDTVENELGHPLNIRLAATWGTQLGLVEARGDAVRFPHSIMQAYLGSRLIDTAMKEEKYLEEALKTPGRELLIALVMHSRSKVAEARRHGASEAPVAVPQPGADDQRLQAVLCRAASERSDEKALDLYAAALEIDSVDPLPRHEVIAAELRERWPHVSAPDHRTLEEAKLNVVRRFGDAARTVAEQGKLRPARPASPAYRQLYRIICLEGSYPVRLAAAQEIGAGGDEAIAALADVLGPHDNPDLPPEPPAAGTRGARRLTLPAQPARRKRNHRSGNDAGRRQADIGRQAGPDRDEAEERRWRELVARAWLAPLLVGSATPERTGDVRLNLRQWLHLVQRQDSRRGEGLSLEVALAQGFKNAANRRPRRSQTQLEARDYLVEQAREMLRGTRFWFTRLTLLHALCLASLPDDPSTRPSGGSADDDPNALVNHWIAIPNTQQDHPFVVEARKLAVLALATRKPERFIWIDESGVMSKVGSLPSRPTSPRKHNLWIPPSIGWAALHPRAQQLVADVLVLLNLAERGQPSDRDQRLHRTDQQHLPPCLTGDRSPLNPRRAATVATWTPGTNCKHGCPFELCPYPPTGEKSHRIELSEAFCRRQEALLRRGAVRRKTAPWQGALAGELREFWRQMGQRAQPSEAQHEEAGKRRWSRSHPPR